MRLILGIFAVAITNLLNAQCTLDLTVSNYTVPCGSTVTMSAAAYSSTPALSTNFNNNALGPGWTQTNSSSVMYTNPCGPTLDGTPAAWMGSGASQPRMITTAAFDVSCGGQVCFDLDFANDENNTDCEDPDQPNEGVYFRYSVNGGATWIDIFYFQPNSTMSGPYYSWANYCFPIPAGAMTANTMFRWEQPNGSTANWDHWGIDNVVITPLVCGGPANFEWSNDPGVNQSSQSVQITSDTTLTVFYNDGLNACDSTFTINVIMPEVINSNGTSTYCAGEAVADITVQATGQSPFTIDYTLDGIPNSVTGPGPMISLGNAPGVYQITGITDDGCYNAANQSETITINPLPDAGTDAIIAYCSDGTPEDLFLLLGPNAHPIGQWYDPSGNPVTMPHDPATMPSGQYMYVADALSCKDTAYVDVSHIFVDVTNITETPVTCNGLSDGSIVVTGVNFVEYNIDSGTNYPLSNPGTVGGFAAGTYLLTVTSPEGCTSSEPFTVTEPLPLTLSSDVIDASCYDFCDGEALITSMGGVAPYSYNWQGQNGDQLGNVQDLCAGTYTIVVQDIFNCEAQIDYTVTEPVNVIPLVIVDTAAGCYPHQVDFTNVTVSDIIETTYIDFGDGNVMTYPGSPVFEHTYDKPGVYDVYMLVTTSDGCQFEYTFEELVEAYDNPIANFYVNPNNVSMLEASVGLVNASTENMSLYEWSIPYGDPDTSNNENINHIQYPLDMPGQYPVSLWITDENGCQDSITKYVSILNDITFFAPNTFTPDGDEHNQNWEYYINGIDVYDFNIKIFDRWGELIWESNDVDVFWDGTYNGRIVETGTYVWIMECGDLHNDSRYTFNGHVNVLK